MIDWISLISFFGNYTLQVIVVFGVLITFTLFLPAIKYRKTKIREAWAGEFKVMKKLAKDYKLRGKVKDLFKNIEEDKKEFILNHLRNKKFIIDSGRGYISLTPLGFSRLTDSFVYEIKDSGEIYLKYLAILLTMVSIFVISAGIQLQSIQASILDKQTLILDSTSQSNLPEILLVSSQGYRSYRISELSNGSYREIGIGVTNLGKATAPHLNVGIDDDYFLGYKVYNGGSLEQTFTIEKLDSFNYNYTFFRFWIKPQNYGDIKIGENTINFKINCPTCEEPVSVQNISICIYLDSPIECGDKWKNSH